MALRLCSEPVQANRAALKLFTEWNFSRALLKFNVHETFLCFVVQFCEIRRLVPDKLFCSLAIVLILTFLTQER